MASDLSDVFFDDDGDYIDGPGGHAAGHAPAEESDLWVADSASDGDRGADDGGGGGGGGRLCGVRGASSSCADAAEEAASGAASAAASAGAVGGMMAQDAEARKRVHYTMGYRDGLDEGRNATAQVGFNRGFAVGVAVGMWDVQAAAVASAMRQLPASTLHKLALAEPAAIEGMVSAMFRLGPSMASRHQAGNSPSHIDALAARGHTSGGGGGSDGGAAGASAGNFATGGGGGGDATATTGRSGELAQAAQTRAPAVVEGTQGGDPSGARALAPEPSLATAESEAEPSGATNHGGRPEGSQEVGQQHGAVVEVQSPRATAVPLKDGGGEPSPDRDSDPRTVKRGHASVQRVDVHAPLTLRTTTDDVLRGSQQPLLFWTNLSSSSSSSSSSSRDGDKGSRCSIASSAAGPLASPRSPSSSSGGGRGGDVCATDAHAADSTSQGMHARVVPSGSRCETSTAAEAPGPEASDGLGSVEGAAVLQVQQEFQERVLAALNPPLGVWAKLLPHVQSSPGGESSGEG